MASLSSRFFRSSVRCKFSAVPSVRNFSISSPKNAKVTLIGAAGNVGKNLSLLLKLNPMVSSLHLADVRDVSGITEELSHIDTGCDVFGFSGPNCVTRASNFADIVVICINPLKTSSETPLSDFDANAEIVWDILQKIDRKYLPKIAVISRYVNSLIPVISSFYSKLHPIYYDNLIFGVNTIDVVRAGRLYSKFMGCPEKTLNVPVIGGHSKETMVPLLSYSEMPIDDPTLYEKAVEMIRNSEDSLKRISGEKNYCSLSMAYSANRFLNSLLESHYGKSAYECAYVRSHAVNGLDFMSELLCFDKLGMARYLNISKISDTENFLFEKSVQILKKDIERGYKYANQKLNTYEKSKNDIISEEASSEY